MKTLFAPDTAEELKTRIAALRPESVRQWGSMTVTQAVAHCSAGIAMAMGEIRPPRALIGRIFGLVIKPMALANDALMRRNSPTSPQLIGTDSGNLYGEKVRLCEKIDGFVTAGPAGCTSHPHPFFGRLTPDEWANLMVKHLDHHLRQFGA